MRDMKVQKVLAAVALASFVSTAPTMAAALAAAPARGTLPPASSSHGATYGEWAARWWQWALSAPAPVNPLADTTGEDCAVGQTGRVWFLAGTLGSGTVVRTCTVPTGSALFVPVLNSAFIATEPEETEDLAHQQVTDRVNSYDTSLLSVTIDGRSLRDLSAYRAHSPTFHVTLPDGNLFGLPPGTYGPAATDGYWVMLHPLPPGEHTVEIRGVFPNGGVLDVTYHLAVAPGG